MDQHKTYKGSISFLLPHQIYVFGSNQMGINGNPSKGTGGAALTALVNGWVRQGEVMDNRLSDSGMAWGLTTVTAPGRKLSKTPQEIISGISLLYHYASSHTDNEFMVAYSGLYPKRVSLNGYSIEQIANMFNFADIPINIVFEEKFYELIKNAGW